MNQETVNDYQDKVRRFLATPHSSKAYYDEYVKEHENTSFDDYTKKLEMLVDKLDGNKIKDQDELCSEIKTLKLPHNQFGCSQ